MPSCCLHFLLNVKNIKKKRAGVQLGNNVFDPWDTELPTILGAHTLGGEWGSSGS